MITKFKDWIFTRFPYFYSQLDTYKDSNGKGLFERYMSVFGDELDQEIVPKIEEVLNLVDAQITPDRFLTPLSKSLGSPPDVSLSPEQYRNLLSFIVDFYKIKGTIKAYELFFYFMGFSVTIEEINTSEILYDEPTILYDSQFHDTILQVRYDERCFTCSYYTIDFVSIDPGNITLTPEVVDKLALAIDFNEPINAILLSYTYGISFSELVTTCITEKITIQAVENRYYDNPANSYDTGLLYDFENIISTSNHVGDSPSCPL